NVSNTEIAATGQLMMLTQRLGKSVNQFLSIEGISPETAFLLGKDANTFRDLMDAFNHGDSNLRIAESRDPEVKAKLQELANV
ncbi:type IV pili methyl-accepting chemotaxis transducer N-terminal domain-containing protein, partial [Acinetobacter baumannii]